MLGQVSISPIGVRFSSGLKQLQANVLNEHSPEHQLTARWQRLSCASKKLKQKAATSSSGRNPSHGPFSKLIFT